MVVNGTIMVLEDNTKDSELTKNNIERKMAWIQAAWSGSCGSTTAGTPLVPSQAVAGCL